MIKVIIVDPIFRGSRLYYSSMAYDTFARAGMSPVIVTRKEFGSADFPTYFKSDRDIRPAIELPPGFWYGLIEPNKVSELINAVIAEAADDTDVTDGVHVHFSGLNEMFPSLLNMLPERLATAECNFSISMVNYDARHLLTSDKPNYLKLRKTITDFLEQMPAARMLFLDDRLNSALWPWLRRQVVVMPDPAPLSEEEIAWAQSDQEPSRLYDANDSRIRVTAIGRQSDRKGLRDIIAAADGLDRNGNTRIYVTGPLETSQSDLREALVAVTPEPVVWRDDYVSEDEIRRTYRDADYILLPYDTSFEGSSGVFAYAAAFGKPIISTAHGCIGHRVKEYELGFVYDFGDTTALANILQDLPCPNSESYQSRREALAAYQQDHNLEAFQKRLVEVVTNAQSAIKVSSDLVGESATFTSEPDATLTPSSIWCGSGMLQASLEDAGHAPRKLDYKQILLFDTAVSSRNLGDQIIMESIRSLLRLIFPKCSFVNVPTHEYTGTEALKLMEKSEYKFVCGTNLLASHVDDYKQWKLQGLDAFLLSDLILLGVGWWQYQQEPNPYSRLLYRRILSGMALHSVRDEYTKKQLATAGIRNVANTCCPTTWWLTAHHQSRIPTEKSPAAVFTVTDYNKNLTADRNLVQLLMHHYDEVYCWLQGAEDYAYVRRIAPESVQFIAPTLEAYTEFLAKTKCDYIGTRLHGGIRALQSGRRALVLAVDNRAKEIASDIRLPVIARENTQAIRNCLEQGWAHEIAVPYAAINSWIRQFGHAEGFDLETAIDNFYHKVGRSPLSAVT
ncbi:MAG: polysaccharide pyruvyl transferase family protein [Hyphomicrobiaceae bacterium]|nr:polysaccharide pyruvyl transferase family protein [Hyphomicrobiaceae bacterium]